MHQCDVTRTDCVLGVGCCALSLNAAVPRWTECLSVSGRTRRFVIGGLKRKKMK